MTGGSNFLGGGWGGGEEWEGGEVSQVGGGEGGTSVNVSELKIVI